MESLKGIEKVIRELEPNIKKTDESYRVATILLASALNGQKDAADVARFTKLPQDFVATVMRRLSRNGIGWQRGRFVHGGWFEKDGSGGVAFWLDVMVGQGYFKAVSKAPARRTRTTKKEQK